MANLAQYTNTTLYFHDRMLNVVLPSEMGIDVYTKISDALYLLHLFLINKQFGCMLKGFLPRVKNYVICLIDV